MRMGRGGLVAYVEAQLERDIMQGRLPPGGQFGSEAKLARHYETCRGTIREALRRLAARGLVVQRPGRKTRAVALDESLTLENLGLALHDARTPEARWLLESAFSLKRQVLLELLSDCCARGSELDLNRLADACYKLQDAAHWESGAWCAQVEFELLRLAARVAERPGYVLLVQSLQRAFLGGVAQLLPLMGGELLREWAWCAMRALGERDALALQHKLPVLMKACDERVLAQFAPAVPEAHRAQDCLLDAPAPVVAPAASAAAQDEELATHPDGEEHVPCGLATATARETHPDIEAPGLGHLAPASEAIGDLKVAPRPHAETLPMEPDSEALFPAPAGFDSSEPDEVCVRDMQGAVLGVLSGCRAGRGTSSPMGDPQFEPPSTGALGHTGGAVRNEGGLLHAILGRLRRGAARLLRKASRAWRASGGTPPGRTRRGTAPPPGA
ncbi:FadR/GntR family transcriptional regulator [Corallococcus caeni]|uniref:FadR/GntR family transcriptional regulator n=1 Tax=Corallococcus caeni TaxID=3082388 RepID=UPI0030C6757F